MRYVLVFVLLLIGRESSAQGDTLYIPTRPEIRKPIICYPPTNDGTVLWSKRMWRTLDLRDPFHQGFTGDSVRASVFDVLKSALLADPPRLQAYANPLHYENFRVPLTPAEIEAIFVEWDTSYGADSGKFWVDVLRKEMSSQECAGFLLKEDWYFDKARMVMDARIFSISPMKAQVSQAGDTLGYFPLFSVYFPEAEPLLRKEKAAASTFHHYTLADLFQKRLFNSLAIKDDRIYYSRDIAHMAALDALLAAGRARSVVENAERDIWKF